MNFTNGVEQLMTTEELMNLENKLSVQNKVDCLAIIEGIEIHPYSEKNLNDFLRGYSVKEIIEKTQDNTFNYFGQYFIEDNNGHIVTFDSMQEFVDREWSFAWMKDHIEELIDEVPCIQQILNEMK